VSCSFNHPIDCLTSAASSVAGDAFAAIARDFGKAADAAINWLWGQLSSATAVHLGGHGFQVDLGIVTAITAVVAVGLFIIQLIASTLRRDPGGLARAAKGLFVAFIAGGAAIAVTNLLLRAVDSLSAGVVQVAMGTSIDGMGHALLTGTQILQVGNPAAMMLFSLAAIAAVVIVWFALMVRKVLIVVSAVFAPLAFAGSLADITVSWTRKWIEIMVALIFSKLLLVIVFVVGWAVLDGGAGRTGSGAGQNVTQTAAGLLILGVAGLAPWMALRLVHFSGDQFHHIHAMATSATSGAQVAVSAPQKAAAWKATGTGLVTTAPAGNNGAPRPPVSQHNGAKPSQPSGVASGRSGPQGPFGNGPGGPAPAGRGPETPAGGSTSTPGSGSTPPAPNSQPKEPPPASPPPTAPGASRSRPHTPRT
jgi:hypothetical protein